VGQQTLDGTDITDRRERYRELVGERLPKTAQQAGTWPIDEDHCFARVVLDNVFEDEWYDHVGGRPVYKHLSPDELTAAISLAERLLEQGAPLVREVNYPCLLARCRGLVEAGASCFDDATCRYFKSIRSGRSLRRRTFGVNHS